MAHSVVNFDKRQRTRLDTSLPEIELCDDHGDVVVLRIEGQLRSVRLGQMFRMNGERFAILNTAQGVSFLASESGAPWGDVVDLSQGSTAWRKLYQRLLLSRGIGIAITRSLPWIATLAALVVLVSSLLHLESEAHAPVRPPLSPLVAHSERWLDTRWAEARNAPQAEPVATPEVPGAEALSAAEVPSVPPPPKPELSTPKRMVRKMKSRTPPSLDEDAAFFLHGTRGEP